MYLVAALTVAAKQREVGTGGAVLRSVVVQTFGVNPQAPYLAAGEKKTNKRQYNFKKCCLLLIHSVLSRISLRTKIILFFFSLRFAYFPHHHTAIKQSI